jgi:hypothetical protein
VTATNTAGGTLTYSWRITGANATINTSSTSSTTVTGLGVTGTTELYCNITNSVTGVTYPSPTCIITWTSSTPTSPTIGLSSSGDTTFTINWTAPSDDGGSPIIGYKVEYSINSGTSWSTLVDAGLVLTYQWSNLPNGDTYIGRVLAYNSIGDGTVSSNSVGRVPTFAAPTITAVGDVPGYPTPTAALRRPFRITFTPTNCVNYSKTSMFILGPYESFGNYSIYANGSFTPVETTSAAAGQTWDIFNLYQQQAFSGSQFYNVGTSETYQIYIVTYNTSGYGVASPVWLSPTYYITSAPIFNGYTFSTNTVQTGTFNCNARAFSQVGIYSIGDSDTSITGLTVNANTVAGVTICTTARAFAVYFSGTSTSGGTGGVVLSGLQAPWSTNSGTTYRALAWAQTVAYGNPGAGRITVTGRAASTLATWPTQPQNVFVVISQQIRTATYY